MNKKGFTLIELISVIVVLAVIALIVFPSIGSVVRNQKEKSYNIQIENLISAGKKYMINHTEELPLEDGSDIKCLSLTDLYEAGEISTDDISDPRENEDKITGYIAVKYSVDYNQYVYTYTETCAD